MNYKLRRLELKDAKGMLEWMGDSRINCFYTDTVKNATLESVNNFINEAADLFDRGITHHYAIVDAAIDSYLGTISLKNIEKVKGAEYAISLRYAYQGRGIASWATKEIFKIAFAEMGLNRVYLNVLSDNEHANTFYERMGFRFEGESKQCIMIGDEMKSLKWYAILSHEYKGGIYEK